MAFEVRLLGSVEALVDGHPLALGGSKQRSVVAMLALQANTTLSADELIDALCGDDIGNRIFNKHGREIIENLERVETRT